MVCKYICLLTLELCLLPFLDPIVDKVGRSKKPKQIAVLIAIFLDRLPPLRFQKTWNSSKLFHCSLLLYLTIFDGGLPSPRKQIYVEVKQMF